MKTAVIFLECEGDSDHPAHSDPVMMVVMAATLKDTEKILTLRLGLFLSEPLEDTIELYRPKEEVMKILEGMTTLLKGEDLSVDSFDGMKELEV